MFPSSRIVHGGYRIATILFLGQDFNIDRSFKKLGQLQNVDPKTRRTIDQYELNSDELTFQVHNRILFHPESGSGNWKIVIPEGIRSLMDAVHSKINHPGVYKT